jgi:geranylgeranyl pyrophosphate synthase
MTPSHRTHAIYLSVIAVLVLVLVVAAAKALRARRVLAEIEERFGLKDNGRAAPARVLRQLAAAELVRPRTYEQYRREVDALIQRAQALEEFGAKTKLAQACASALVGGKRLRAVVVLEVARAVSAAGAADPVDVAEAALFVEYLHAASLVIDDLPEFDNDATRRGRPALHAEVGPAVAQMAALALVAAAFQNIGRQIDWIRDRCPEIKNADRIGTRLCGEVSRALGAVGAASGQYMDVSAPEDLYREHGPDAVALLAARKTATFFEIAFVAGWLLAGGSPDQVDTVRKAGHHVGAAFQIADDIGDISQDAARATEGRPGWNFANEFGRDVAETELSRHLNGARLLMTQCGLWTRIWESEIFPMIRKMAGDAPEDVAAAA